jgi:hypothetical protein
MEAGLRVIKTVSLHSTTTQTPTRIFFVVTKNTFSIVESQYEENASL